MQNLVHNVSLTALLEAQDPHTDYVIDSWAAHLQYSHILCRETAPLWKIRNISRHILFYDCHDWLFISYISSSSKQRCCIPLYTIAFKDKDCTSLQQPVITSRSSRCFSKQKRGPTILESHVETVFPLLKKHIMLRIVAELKFWLPRIRKGDIEYSTIKLVSTGRTCRLREGVLSELAQKLHASGNSSILFIAKVMKALYSAVDSSLDGRVSALPQCCIVLTRRSQQSRTSMNGFERDVSSTSGRP